MYTEYGSISSIALLTSEVNMNFYIFGWFHVTLCVKRVDPRERLKEKAKKSWGEASDFYVSYVTEELCEVARALSKIEGEEVLSWFHFKGLSEASRAELKTISGEVICRVNVLRFGSATDGNIHKVAVVEMPESSLECFNRAVFDIFTKTGKVSKVSFQAL